MRICVFGAGAVGGYIAAYLSKAGNDVSVVARGEHLAAMRTKGLTLDHAGNRFTVSPQATDDAREIGPVDAVVLTAKAPALSAIAAQLAPLLGPDTTVISAQNGIPWWYAHQGPEVSSGTSALIDPEGAMANHVGPQRAVGCVIDCPARVVEPGLVVGNAQRKGRYTMGEPGGDTSDRLTRISQAFEAAGMLAPISDDIRRVIWAKLLINLSRSPIGVLTGADEHAMAKDEDVNDVAMTMLAEAQAIARRHGHDIEIDIAAERDPSTRVVHRSSMLQDWDLGRPMEVDAIVGAVQALGWDAGLPTPTVDVVLALLRQKARVAGIY